MIYADHAATSPILPCAQKAMMECMKYGANPSSQHSMGVWAKEKLEEARETVANCINASPEEIIFTSGATESNNLAAHAAKKFWIDKVYVSSYEHKSMEKAARILSFENRLPFTKLSWREINKPYLLNKNMHNSFVSINMVDSITGLISDVQGFIHYFFDLLDATCHRAEIDKLCFRLSGNNTCKSRFSHSRRSPKDHRRNLISLNELS